MFLRFSVSNPDYFERFFVVYRTFSSGLKNVFFKLYIVPALVFQKVSSFESCCFLLQLDFGFFV